MDQSAHCTHKRPTAARRERERAPRAEEWHANDRYNESFSFFFSSLSSISPSYGPLCWPVCVCVPLLLLLLYLSTFQGHWRSIITRATDWSARRRSWRRRRRRRRRLLLLLLLRKEMRTVDDNNKGRREREKERGRDLKQEKKRQKKNNKRKQLQNTILFITRFPTGGAESTTAQLAPLCRYFLPFLCYRPSPCSDLLVPFSSSPSSSR